MWRCICSGRKSLLTCAAKNPFSTSSVSSTSPGQLPVRPSFGRTHEQCVRVAHVAHTQHVWFRVVWGSVHVAQVAGVVAHSHRAHHSVVVIREEQLVARRVVAHSPYVEIILAGSDERLLREAANELQARGG